MIELLFFFLPPFPFLFSGKGMLSPPPTFHFLGILNQLVPEFAHGSRSPRNKGLCASGQLCLSALRGSWWPRGQQWLPGDGGAHVNPGDMLNYSSKSS